MVVIRLARGGDKKNPFYRIVAADKRFPRDGRYIEQLGYYDPMARGQATPIQLDFERIDYWHGVGAIMSDRVAYLVKRTRKGESLTAGISRDEAKKAQTLHSAKSAKANTEQKAAEDSAAAQAEKPAAAPAKEAPKAEEPVAAPAKEAPKAEEPVAAPAKEAPKAEEPAAAPAKEAPKAEKPAAAPATEAPKAEEPAAAPAKEAPKAEEPAAAPAKETPAKAEEPAAEEAKDTTSDEAEGKE